MRRSSLQGCPTWGRGSRLTLSWKGVTCRVCTALYASWPWRRIARLIERVLVVEADRRHDTQMRALGLKKRFPRWLLALLPGLVCLFCPAHLVLIASFLGGGSMLGLHVAEHHTENWHVIVAVAVAVWGGLLFERWHHHRKGCHGHHDHDHHRS